MNLSAIVLCGGSSRRMGRDKSSLDFGVETMLGRVVRQLAIQTPVDRIVCVAAIEQTLPELPRGVRVVHDRRPDAGPLEGLATGLSELSMAEAAFVTTCDAPLVAPELPEFLASLLDEHDAVAPRIDGQLYPLTAVYRSKVHEIANRRLADGQRRVIDFVAELNVRYIDDELKRIDPQLLSIRNCNTMAEYAALLEIDANTQRRQDAQR